MLSAQPLEDTAAICADRRRAVVAGIRHRRTDPSGRPVVARRPRSNGHRARAAKKKRTTDKITCSDKAHDKQNVTERMGKNHSKEAEAQHRTTESIAETVRNFHRMISAIILIVKSKKVT